MRSRRLGYITALFLCSAMVGCGSSSSVGSGPVPGATASPAASGTANASASASPTAGASKASASPTASPIVAQTPISVVATPSASPMPTPSPSPTQSGYTLSGVTTCTASDETIPGTYTTLDTNGNVVGNTYTEDTSAINSYLVNSYVASAATGAPTASASATPLPTPGPNAPTEMITIYIGEYSVPAFVGVLFPTVYQASATSGCFMMVLEQTAGGTAGQTRHRDAAGSDNSFGIGELANPSSSYTSTNVDAEALNSLTITNLTATTGAGTFALSNGTNGTLTITGSGTIVANQASTTDRTRNPAIQRLRALLEHNARNPFERPF